MSIIHILFIIVIGTPVLFILLNVVVDILPDEYMKDSPKSNNNAPTTKNLERTDIYKKGMSWFPDIKHHTDNIRVHRISGLKNKLLCMAIDQLLLDVNNVYKHISQIPPTENIVIRQIFTVHLENLKDSLLGYAKSLEISDKIDIVRANTLGKEIYIVVKHMSSSLNSYLSEESKRNMDLSLHHNNTMKEMLKIGLLKQDKHFVSESEEWDKSRVTDPFNDTPVWTGKKFVKVTNLYDDDWDGYDIE